MSHPAPCYVVGHERSGTHLLLNTLLRNADVQPQFYSVNGWRGPYTEDEPGRFWNVEQLGRDWDAIAARASLIKTHCDRGLFAARYPRAQVLYVLRDPRDTLVSAFHFFRHPSMAQVACAPQDRCETVAEYLRHPASDYLRWAYSLHDAGDTVAERWARHVSGWLSAPDTLVVRYEDLVTDYRVVLGRVANFLGLDLLPALAPVGLHDCFSFAPRTGVIGDGHRAMTEADEALVQEAVAHAGLDWDAMVWQEGALCRG